MEVKKREIILSDTLENSTYRNLNKMSFHKKQFQENRETQNKNPIIKIEHNEISETKYICTY